jgi:hypothetical protein
MTFDKEEIGKLIKIGGEHLVYFYGRDQVIKFPNFLARVLFNHSHLAQKKKADFALAKKYFPQYLLETECNLNESRWPSYNLIQPFIKARPLSFKDLANGAIKKKFIEILSINDKIKKEQNLSFDFYGAWRLLFHEIIPSHTINNLMLTLDNQIVILDVVFLEYNSCSWSKLLCLISRWAEKRQTKLLAKIK